MSQLLHYVADEAEHERNWEIYVQALTYVYIPVVDRLKPLLLISIVSSRNHPGPTALKSPAALPIAASAPTSTQTLKARLLPGVATMRQEVGSQLKFSLQQYIEYQNWRISNALLLCSAGQGINHDRPSMTTFAADSLVTESYRMLMPLRQHHLG